ncbi:hypothetical protein OG871_40655 (plasmid) [Kitasatospora sp. NBC_00374]|uniref:hypothetical protein n=1 Tax=Kitasatospora sp. NBC_00374 TaxID=2975964 RepID=UPI002F916094
MTGMIIDAKPTPYFLARCAECARPVRTETPNPPCPECGTSLRSERLYAVTRDESCDGACMNAFGPSCSCSCGGENHGKSFGAQSTREETEKAVNAYRARVAKEEEKRAKRAATKRARAEREFTDWSTDRPGRAELLAYLADGPHDSSFVVDMARQVARLEPMTERQEAAVERCMEYARRRAEEAARRAQEAAAAAPVPTGKALEITGEIILAKYEDTDYGSGGRYKMLVRGDGGWRVWSTVPATLTRVISGGTASELQGKRVKFTADVEPSPKDPSFGFAKRPRKALTIA